KRREIAEVLPPLKVPDNSTNAPAELSFKSNEAPAEVEIPEIDLEYATPEMSAPISGSTTNAPAGPMVPQMLLRYFGRTTNQEAIISAPVEFYPPPPPATRSSAVYISR